jgi:hypothetical protein
MGKAFRGLQHFSSLYNKVAEALLPDAVALLQKAAIGEGFRQGLCAARLAVAAFALVFP